MTAADLENRLEQQEGVRLASNSIFFQLDKGIRMRQIKVCDVKRGRAKVYEAL